MHRTYSLFAAGLCLLGTVSWLYWRRKRSKEPQRPRMKLYWFDNFRSKRCEWLIAELGAMNDVEMVNMNPRDPDGEKLARYRDIHPYGTVPCLEIEGRQPILESGAICMYLAHVYKRLGPELDKEAYYSWLVLTVATLDEIMEVLFVQWMFTDNKHQDIDLINKMMEKFQTFAKHLSRFLTHREFICGNRLTAVDCVLGYNMWWASVMRDGLLLKGYPVLQDYYSRLRRRSAFQRVFTQ